MSRSPSTVLKIVFVNCCLSLSSPHPSLQLIVLQAVLDANIIPPLLRILTDGDFKTRKEAAWAISNATSGGSDLQIR